MTQQSTAHQLACSLGVWGSGGQEPALERPLGLRRHLQVYSHVQQTCVTLRGPGHRALLHPCGLKTCVGIGRWRGAGWGSWLFKKSGESLTLLGVSWGFQRVHGKSHCGKEGWPLAESLTGLTSSSWGPHLMGGEAKVELSPAAHECRQGQPWIRALSSPGAWQDVAFITMSRPCSLGSRTQPTWQGDLGCRERAGRLWPTGQEDSGSPGVTSVL